MTNLRKVKTTRCPQCGAWYAASACAPGARCNDASDGQDRCRGRVVLVDDLIALNESPLFSGFSVEKRERMATFLEDIHTGFANRFMPKGQDEHRAEKAFALGLASHRILVLVEELRDAGA